MRVRYTATALAEIAEIISYIAKDNPKAAGDVARAIERTVALISNHPKAAPVVHEDNVRARRAGRYQYRVFYVVEEDELIIRNVRSTRRMRPWEPDPA
jgi:toxin ParE1/3/4